MWKEMTMSESGVGGYGEPEPSVEAVPPEEITNPPLPDGGPGKHHDDGPDTPPESTQDEPLLT